MEPPSSPPQLVGGRIGAMRIRKRRFESTQDDCHMDSSDPPVFSSDPPEPSLDAGNCKRQYKGAWWGDEDAERSKTDFSRNFDSGVFMASDDSLPSADQGKQENRLHNRLVEKSPQRRAQEIIERCLEEGEVVDLSGLQLRAMENSLLAPLRSIIKTPRFFDRGVSPSEKDYHSLHPFLEIYLAHNSLDAIPPVIWSLESLTVLSLRNNNLGSLPASISRLHNLVELNVANNLLRYLPAELLDLIGPNKKLAKLCVRPNPLFQGVQFHGAIAERRQWIIPATATSFEAAMDDLRTLARSALAPGASQAAWMLKLMESLRQMMSEGDIFHAVGPRCLWEEKHFAFRTVLVASTSVTNFCIDGSLPYGETCPSQMCMEDLLLPADPYPPSKRTNGGSAVPSLLELAVSACAACLPFPQLERLLPDTTPQPVVRALRMACNAVEEGGRSCSVCLRGYAVLRTEWIEYWHCIPGGASAVSLDDLFWPFLRRGCSPRCAI